MAKLYLLDANVPITAHNTYYPLDAVPEYWSWLQHRASTGLIKMPPETFNELKAGNEEDMLHKWAKQAEVSSVLLLKETVSVENVRVVLSCYGSDLTDDELQTIGQDPFLIAYCLADPENRIVVTTEVSKPTKQRQNRHVPDVCNDAGVKWCDPFSLLRDLKFRTGWQAATG